MTLVATVWLFVLAESPSRRRPSSRRNPSSVYTRTATAGRRLDEDRPRDAMNAPGPFLPEGVERQRL